MKLTYLKPTLQIFGGIETLTQATGASPNVDFVFFNGTPIGNPNDPDDGAYSYFCDPTGCSIGSTP